MWIHRIISIWWKTTKSGIVPPQVPFKRHILSWAVTLTVTLVALCEKEGFIPRYYIDEPKDRVDAVLADTKDYVRSLVTEEMNLGNLIENAIKTMAREEEKEEDEEITEDELTTLEEVTELTD